MIKIAVIDAGWVIVGECVERTDTIDLRNASVVRVWGTTEGLGQIALDGPTPETKLDKIGTVFVQKSALKFLISCEESKWTKKL